MASLYTVCALLSLLFGIILPSAMPALPSTLLGWPLGLVSIALICFSPSRVPGWFLLGLLIGLQHGWQWQSRRIPANCEGEQLQAVGYVASLPRVTRLPDGRLRQRFEFGLESFPARCGKTRRLLLSLYGDRPALSPGSRWQLQIVLRRPWGLANAGSFNMQAWFAQSAIDAVGSVKGEPLEMQGRPFRTFHHELRGRIAEAIRSLGLAPGPQALLLAVSVADRSDIDPQLWQRLQAFGLNHLLVVSGLHIGMVAGLGYCLGGFLQRAWRLWGGGSPVRLALPALTSFSLALLYAALAGFSLSTQRALLMVSVFVALSLVGRQVSPWLSLLLAAVGLSLVNPLAWLGSGAWLSFASVGLLLWIGQWQLGTRVAGLSRYRHHASAVLKTHVAMSLLMIPLGAWWFGGFSTVAALANLVLVPAVGLFLVPMALAGLLAWLCGLSSLAGVLWQAAAWPLGGVLGGLEFIETAYATAIYRHIQVRPVPMFFGLVALGLVLLPGAVRLKLLACISAMPLLLVAWMPQAPSQRFSLTVLDVGQGTAVLVEAGGRSLLYDTGGGDPAGLNMAGSVILPYLRHRRVDRLEQVVISHADTDHSAGLPLLRESMPIEELWLNRHMPGTDSRLCRAGVSWRWPDGVKFRFLAPGTNPPALENDASCVLQISIAGRRFLLPGDISVAQEREVQRYWRSELASDWLLAGHHGSNTSTAASWLRQVAPDEVVFGRGYANPFGHPHPAVQHRIAQRGAGVGDTAIEGALIYSLGWDGAWRREARRDGDQRYWLH